MNCDYCGNESVRTTYYPRIETNACKRCERFAQTEESEQLAKDREYDDMLAADAQLYYMHYFETEYNRDAYSDDADWYFPAY